MKRRIAAIMVSDVVGYSSMMEKAEERTAERLVACQALISEKVALLDGRIFDTAGDATLKSSRADQCRARRPRSAMRSRSQRHLTANH